MSTMRIFREILFVKQQMETADAREVKCLSHRLAELRGAHANAINADVLVEIFSWLLPPNLAYPSKYDAPLNVSHVCRAWRLVTLSNPILWSKFRLYGDADSEPAFPNQEDSIDNIFHPRFEAAVEAWDVWLVRSGSSPLGIEIYLDALQWSLDDYKRIIKILTMTLSHQKRWKYIKIDFPHKAHDVAFTMCDMPLLETLSIFVYAVRREGSTCGKLDVCLDLSCAPRLRELRMTQITCLKDPMPTLCNLRILAMSDDDCSDDDYFDHANLTWNVFIQTLRCAPQLQSIEDATLDVSDVRDAPEVILPLVREATFQLTERQPNAVYCALSQLVMPSLVTFVISVFDDEVHIPADLSSVFTGIKSLLLRSHCPLTYLKLNLLGYGVSQPDHDRNRILDLLHALPKLRHLILYMRNLDDAFLRALTIAPASADSEPQNTLCPALASIMFPDSRHDMSAEGFYQMVASRYRRAGQMLWQVGIAGIYLEDASRETRDVIDNLVAEGLEIEETEETAETP